MIKHFYTISSINQKNENVAFVSCQDFAKIGDRVRVAPELPGVWQVVRVWDKNAKSRDGWSKTYQLRRV